MAATSSATDDVVEGWKGYFAYLTSLLNECKRHQETDSVEKAIYLRDTLERYTQSTDRLLATVKDAVNFPADYAGVSMSECAELELLLERLVHVLRLLWLPYWRRHVEALELQSLSCPGQSEQLIDQVQEIHTGKCACTSMSNTPRYTIHCLQVNGADQNL